MAEDAGSIYSEIRIRLDALGIDILKAEAAVKKMGEQLDKTSKTDSEKISKNYTKAFDAITVGAAAMSVASVAAFKGLVGTFAQTEQSLANVRAVTGASASEFESLRAAAVRAGDETRFSASQAADALYFLASGGLDAAQSIDALNGVLLLAGATQSDLAFTAETVTAVLSQYGLAANQAARVSNVFAAAAANSQATMEKLAVSLRTVGPIAGTLGISLEETTASLEALFNAGFTGETAGTALRDILLDLTNTTGPAAEKLNALGISMESVNPKTVGLTGAIKALGASGATTEQLMAALGKTSGAQLAVLLKTGEKGLLGLEAAVTGTNEAAKQYAIQNDTLAGSLDEFSSKAETAGNNMIQTLTPAFRGILGLAGAVLGFFSSLPTAFIGVLTGAVTLGGGILALNSALGLLGVTMGALMGPISLAAAGVGALVVGVSSAVAEAQRLERVRIDDEFGSIAEQAKRAGESIEDIGSIAKNVERDINLQGIGNLRTNTEELRMSVFRLANAYGTSAETIAKIIIASSKVNDETKKIVDQQFKITEQSNRQAAASRDAAADARGRAFLAKQEAERQASITKEIGDQAQLSKQLLVIDQLVSRGLLTEAEGIKKKIQLRTAAVELIQKEVLTTGQITTAQAAQLKSQNASLEGYKERLKVIEDTGLTELQIRKTSAQLIRNDDARALELFKVGLEEQAAELRKAGVSEAEIEKFKLDQIYQFQVQASEKNAELRAKETEEKDREREEELEKERGKYETLKGYAIGFANAVVNLFTAINAGRIQDIKAEQTASQKALDAEFKAREQAGEDKTALDEEYQARKAAIDEAAAKETAELQYRSAVAAWWLRQAEFLGQAPVAVAKAMADLGPVAGPIVSGITLGAQEAALLAAYPKPPKFETGGMVIGQSGSQGALVQVAENGSTEAIFNSGSAGRPMMEAFADLVAERVQSGPRVIQLVLDRKVISQVVVDDINNGRVRMTR